MTVPLNQLLQAYRGYLSASLLKPELVAYERELDERRDSNWFSGLARTGATIPDMNWPTKAAVLGSDLSGLLTSGPVLLKFYRSYLCPYCTLELKAMQRASAQINAAGANIVAITQDSDAQIATTLARDDITFPILSDPTARCARQLDITYQPGPAETAMLSRCGMNNIGLLSLPALYLIGPGRRVLYAYLDPDPSRRAEPSDVLDYLTINYDSQSINRTCERLQ